MICNDENKYALQLNPMSYHRPRQVTAGQWTTCGIRQSDGGIECWGMRKVSTHDPSKSSTPIAYESKPPDSRHEVRAGEPLHLLGCWV